MRLFIAITLEEALRTRLALRALELTTQLNSPKRAWSPTAAAALHITLKFLGETDVTPESFAQAIRPSTETIPAFRMVVRGVGAFPSAPRARVLWAGVDEGHDELVRVATEVDRACTTLGFPPEARPFTGHITLGRTRRQIHHASAIPVVEGKQPELFGEMVVRDVTLYQSELGPGGSKYTALWHVPLATSA